MTSFIIVCTLLSVWLLFALIVIIMLGKNESFEVVDWIATFLLVFIPPIYAIIKLIFVIDTKIKEKQIKKRRKELFGNKYEDEMEL